MNLWSVVLRIGYIYSKYSFTTLRSEKSRIKMKFKIYVILFLIGFFYSSYAFDDNIFYSKKMEIKGIKQIIEKTYDKWRVISFFDTEGLLLQRISYYKKELRFDVKYDYTVTDTLLEIRRITLFNINAENNTLIDRYYYTSSNQCYKYRVSFSESDNNPFYYEDNFVYYEGMLVSYTQGKNSVTKFIYKYNEKKQKERKLKIINETDTTFYSYMYNQSGQLTDYIQKSNNNENVYSGVVWSNEKMNKIHILFSNFDKHGNWTKSYFITERGKVFRSERKIEYW